MKSYWYQIERVCNIAHALFYFSCKPIEHYLPFVAGQYTIIEYGPKPIYASIANAPQPDGSISFILRSETIIPLVGNLLKLSEAKGDICYRPGNNIYIAGGTGIAPIRALLQINPSATVIWGVRTKAEWGMCDIQAQKIFYSEEKDGLLPDILPHMLPDDAAFANWTVVGPTPMVHKIYELYKKLNPAALKFYSDTRVQL